MIHFGITKYPHIFENFISEEECKILLDFSMNSNKIYEQNTSDHPRWDGKNLYYYQYSDEVKEVDFNIWTRLCKIVRETHPTVRFEYSQYSRWIAGDELDPPHADNIEQDGVTPNYSPWRSHGMVLYLNDDFEGGQLFYPDHFKMIQPKARMMAIHTAGLECTHGVKMVKSGFRHTMVNFGTVDQHFIKENIGSIMPNGR